MPGALKSHQRPPGPDPKSPSPLKIAPVISLLRRASGGFDDPSQFQERREIMPKWKLLLMGPVLFIGLAVTTPMHAVAFKMKNDTSYTFKVRIFDRGRWRP
jgi:hypothetical protein